MLSDMSIGTVKTQGWQQSPDRDRARLNWRIYFVGWSIVLPKTMYTDARQCVCTRVTPPGAFPPVGFSLALVTGPLLVVRRAALIGRAWMARLTFRPADSGLTI